MNQPTIQIDFDLKRLICDLKKDADRANDGNRKAYQEWQRTSGLYEAAVRVARRLCKVPAGYEFNDKTFEFIKWDDTVTRRFPALPCE